ncbi:halocyanin hcpG [Candidatus Halobonum tyrrellensis G22]|uniref:Halocyanin hcpG n=1 Tax=Candidatus Halobonum tyrrellensis G22 TaxID=1324957 RepID=V4GXE7_9EURY|nr:halocyanin hcpG [Candidatus Halobonum tyrrellensis G22]
MGEDSGTDGNASTGSGESTGTPTADPTDTEPASVDVSAETALAAEWNVMRARLHDAVTLGRIGQNAAAASLVGDVFARFERATGEFGAHEGLEATSEELYESFEGNLETARSAFEEGATDEAIGAIDGAGDDLLAAQQERTSDAVADAFTLFVVGSRVRNIDAVAAAGATDAAATVGERVVADFERIPAHDTLESAGEENYEAFEGALGDAVEAANSGDAAAVHEAALSSSSAIVGAAYELVPEAVAGVGHLSLMGAVGFDAEMAGNVGGPGLGLAHAAGLDGYRARVRDAAWLYEAGDTEAAKAAAQSIFQHFEGARAHEALEEADHDAYETFEHEGLESLVSAIENGDDAAVDDAVTAVHDGLTSGIDTLAGEDAPVLESGFFRARLGDARERYGRGEREVAATTAESLFARFEQNEAEFHETLESTSEDLYHSFEEEHLTALPDAFRAGDDEAVDTHLTGAMDTLVEFEATAGSTPVASAAAATYMTGRACDAGVLATLGSTDRAETVASDAFAYFEAGANGFHEAVESASEDRYHAFEEALGSVRTAATGDADAYDAATTFADEATAAVYAVVESGGSAGTNSGDAGIGLSTLVSDVFATFENARVHEILEEGDHEAYETFESALSDYVSALDGGEGVDTATERFAQATRNAAFAVAGAIDEAPEISGGESGGENGGGGESDLQGGPNVVEGVPEDADHVVTMNAVSYDPVELTVSAGDTVAWEWAAGEGHTVTAYEAEMPDGATYWASGGFESEEAARSGWENGEGVVQSGQSYVHTFETTGTHEYFCVPHEAAGMTGTVTVE